MASVYDLKPKFQNLLRPLCGRLAGAGITANQVTITAAVMSVAEGAWIAVSHGSRASLIALPVVLFVRMALNAIDGMLAREWNQKTQLGAWLNEGGDILSDVALYVPFVFVPGVDGNLVIMIVLMSVLAEGAGILALVRDGVRRYDGPFGKSDRAVFFGALAIVLAAGLSPGLWTTIVLWVAVLLAFFTAVNRASKLSRLR